MSAVQQVDKISFGTGRLYATPAGGGQRVKYGDLTDISIDLKTEQKEAYAEPAYPISIADGRRSIDITGKHYTLRLDALAQDLGMAAPVANTIGYAVDEAGTVPAATPFTATLAHGATFVTGTLDLVVNVKNGGIISPVTYNIVAAGSEVAGSAASVSIAGVITFNAGDAGLSFKATYQYGVTATGQMITITNVTQNSSPSYGMTLVKRDRSPLDNSTGYLVAVLNAVRPGSVKGTWKENDYTVYDRTWKAFSDPTGIVGTLTFYNN